MTNGHVTILGEELLAQHPFLRSRQSSLFDIGPSFPSDRPALPAPNPDLAQTLSPSQIRTWLDCQARWWYRYVLHLPDPPNADRSLGLAFHDVVAENFQQKIETKQDIPLTGAVALFRQAWGLRAQEAHWQPEDDPEDLEHLGVIMTGLYLDSAAPYIEPAAVEVPVSGTIAGVDVRGRIDILDTAGRVIDVKTSKRAPCGVNPDYRLQVATYAQLTPASSRARLDTLVKSKTVRLVHQSFTINEADRLETNILYPLCQGGMRAGYYTINRNSYLCTRRHCAYWQRCQDEYGGEVRA